MRQSSHSKPTSDLPKSSWITSWTGARGEIELCPSPNKYVYGGNWKQQIENAVDGYHPAVTHASFFRILQDRVADDPASIMSRFGYDAASPSTARYLGNGHALLDLRHVDRSKMLGAGVPPPPPPPAEEEVFGARLRERVGEERANFILSFRGGDGFNLLVYPNLILINVQIRVVLPTSYDQTEVVAYPTLLRGAPESVNAARIRGMKTFTDRPVSAPPMISRCSSGSGRVCKPPPWSGCYTTAGSTKRLGRATSASASSRTKCRSEASGRIGRL